MKKTHVLDKSLPKEEWSASKPHTPLRRTDRETQRLTDLAKLLDPERVFLVERKVILTSYKAEQDQYVRRGNKMVLASRGVKRRFELRVFNIKAATGAEAGAIADMAKYNLERERGHHTHANKAN